MSTVEDAEPIVIASHWANSGVTWEVGPNPQGPGMLVNFKRAKFPTDEGMGMVADTWGQLMTSLKQYVESGNAAPLFTS